MGLCVCLDNSARLSSGGGRANQRFYSPHDAHSRSWRKWRTDPIAFPVTACHSCSRGRSLWQLTPVPRRWTCASRTRTTRQTRMLWVRSVCGVLVCLVCLWFNSGLVPELNQHVVRRFQDNKLSSCCIHMWITLAPTAAHCTKELTFSFRTCVP